jgi:hypothetical protein
MGQLSRQVKDSLNGLIQVINESEDQLQVVVSTSMIGIVSKRIFNNQEGSKNAAAENLGTYSEAYKTSKAKKYGQALANKVNLYASGTLYGSVKQVKSGGQTFVAVTDVNYPSGTTTTKVAEYLNKQYGEIFAPTEQEVKEIKIIGDEFIKKTTDEYFNR